MIKHIDIHQLYLEYRNKPKKGARKRGMRNHSLFRFINLTVINFESSITRCVSCLIAKLVKINQIPLLSTTNEKRRLFLFKEIVYHCGCEWLYGTYFGRFRGFMVGCEAIAMAQVLPLG